VSAALNAAAAQATALALDVYRESQARRSADSFVLRSFRGGHLRQLLCDPMRGVRDAADFSAHFEGAVPQKHVPPGFEAPAENAGACPTCGSPEQCRLVVLCAVGPTLERVIAPRTG
jgi:hypothetical protein